MAGTIKDVISCLACYSALGVANFSDLAATVFPHSPLYVEIMVSV